MTELRFYPIQRGFRNFTRKVEVWKSQALLFTVTGSINAPLIERGLAYRNSSMNRLLRETENEALKRLHTGDFAKGGTYAKPIIIQI